MPDDELIACAQSGRSFREHECDEVQEKEFEERVNKVFEKKVKKDFG